MAIQTICETDTQRFYFSVHYTYLYHIAFTHSVVYIKATHARGSSKTRQLTREQQPNNINNALTFYNRKENNFYLQRTGHNIHRHTKHRI